jgi:hypothetical protein
MGNFWKVLRNIGLYSVNEGFDIALLSVAILLVLSYVHLERRYTYIIAYNLHETHFQSLPNMRFSFFSS